MNPNHRDRHRVFFLTMVPFPYGLAQTNRLISIAGGLESAGCEVTVLCLKPTENQHNSLNHSPFGNYNQVKFVYTSGTSFRGGDPIRRAYLYIKGIISASGLLIKENKREKIRSVFIGVTPSLIILWYFVVCRILHINFLQERSEYPFVKEGKSWFDKPSLYIYLNIICKLFDGFVVITKNLSRFFAPYLRKNCPVFLLPILTEPERFLPGNGGSMEKYIAYCGSMQGDKDGVPVLIDAFGIISRDFPELRLYLIGSTQFSGFDGLVVKIKLLGLERKIVFTGIVDREHLPEILSRALILVLARPVSKQAEGGFPTKLGEYLATGKPVVVTRVGEIPDYLQDNINAFIAEPNDAGNFAEKLKQVLLNYEKALEIGLEGQKQANTIFNYRVQGKKLTDWLNKIRM